MMNFLLEPLGFSEIVNLWEIYGQKVIDTVFYCTRTFTYYIYREKQIMLGIWPGDPYVNKRGNVLKGTKSVPILGKSSQHISHVPEEVPCLQFQAMRSIMEHDSSVMYMVPKEYFN